MNLDNNELDLELNQIQEDEGMQEGMLNKNKNESSFFEKENDELKVNQGEVIMEEKKAEVNEGGKAVKNARVLPEIIEQALNHEVRVVLTKMGYEVEGFYKFGPIRLEANSEGEFYAIDRKENVQRIKNYDDLVLLNYECWKKSREKGASFINPGKEWMDDFNRLNLVKRQVVFVPGDE